VDFFHFLQNIDTAWFWSLYGLSHQSVWLDVVGVFFAEYTAYLTTVILVVALMWPNKNRDKRRIAVVISVAAAFIARYVVKGVIVFAYQRPRPFVDLATVHPLINSFSWENLQAFPSGHTIFFFALAAALYGFNKKVGIGAFIVAAVVGVSRVYVGVHWPSDILGGAILGILTGWTAFYVYKKYFVHFDKYIKIIFNKNVWRGAVIGAAILSLFYLFAFSNLFATEYRSVTADVAEKFFPLPTLDKADYDARILALAHVATSSGSQVSTTTATSTPRLWPVETTYPNVGAILPFKRIVAYYGNFYSTKMGVLGEYPADQMLAMLASTTAMWTAADPTTPAIPAIHYIATVAQASAGKEGKYILRMPDDQIDHALKLAEKINGIVFLDVQVALSNLQYELPQLEKYLKMPQVHLAIDPEFSMKFGDRPGTVIGTFDANDINYAAQYIAGIVRDNHLPPKILVVHRFTYDMVTNYEKIQPLPEVEIVMDMDGFGSKEKKYGTYNRVIAPEPVQVTGIKLFYKNDVNPPANGLLSPAEVLKLTPSPIYIQYQ